MENLQKAENQHDDNISNTEMEKELLANSITLSLDVRKLFEAYSFRIISPQIYNKMLAEEVEKYNVELNRITRKYEQK